MILGFKKIIQIIIITVVLLVVINGGHLKLYDFVQDEVNSILDFNQDKQIKDYEKFVFELNGNFYKFSNDEDKWIVSTDKENYEISKSFINFNFIEGKNKFLTSQNLKIYKNWQVISKNDFEKEFITISSNACSWSHNFEEGKNQKTKEALITELNINEDSFSEELIKYDVEYKEVLSIISMETGASFIKSNPSVLGDNGKAVGLMQIWPTSAGKEVKEKLGFDFCDTKEGLSNPVNNIKCGIGYLSLCKKKSKNDFEKTARCYNGGYSAIDGSKPCANSYADIALMYYKENN